MFSLFNYVSFGIVIMYWSGNSFFKPLIPMIYLYYSIFTMHLSLFFFNRAKRLVEKSKYLTHNDILITSFLFFITSFIFLMDIGKLLKEFNL